MLLVTWNVNSLKARLERVSAWVDEVRPDVLCMQETKLAQDAFPTDAFRELGYESVHFGQGRWNGVAIVSKVGLEDPTANFAGANPDEEARIVSATCGGVRVSSVYVPNGRALDHDHYRYKLEWMRKLRTHVTTEAAAEAVVAGDFNIAPSDLDVWDPAQLEGSTHVSAPEREVLDELLAAGLVDVVREMYPGERFFSWWDYRNGSFHRGWGMRIDLVLASAALATRATWSGIDRNARKGEQPSDHAPVMVRW